MDELVSLGLRPEEAQAYLALLHGKPIPPPDDEVWDALRAFGLVRRDGPTVRATPPRLALERWAVAREQEAARARHTATTLSLLHEAVDSGKPFVEVLRGRSASAAMYSSLQSGARSLVRAWDRGSYSTDVQTGAPDVTVQALDRGVRYEVVYDGSTLVTGGMMAVLADSVRHGEQSRIFPHLPMKMIIADDDRALIALTADRGDVDSLLVHASLMLDALIALFTMIWDMAVPVASFAEDDHDAADANQSQLLSMLSAGMTDAAIARTLGVSPRTVARRVGELQDRLGARSRFQLAALAARRGWL